MQSSPPTRAWAQPASPTQSQYSIDLAALDLDSRSGASSPELPAPPIDRVLSEDIDGPSDFTQNLEKWMRGGGTMNSRMGTVKRGLNSVREQEEQNQGARRALAPAWQPAREEDDRTESHHTPTDTPPKESVFASSRQTGGNNDETSDWDPYAGAATPQPPPHKQVLLQPTVEDYYSEFTPARPTSTNNISQHQQNHEYRSPHIEQDNIHDKSQFSTPGRPSSETISPVRSPTRSPVRSQVRSPPRSSVRSPDHQFSALQDQLRKHNEELTRLKQAHADKMGRMKQELERLKVSHAHELQSLEQDLELVRRSRDDAEEEARIAQIGLERARRDVQKNEGLHRQLADLGEQLREASRHNEELSLAKKDAEDAAHVTANNLRSELSLLRQTQHEQNTRLTGDHRRAVSMAEELQKQLKEAREHFRAQQTSHESELERMRTTGSVPAPVDDAELRRLRNELETTREQLHTAKASYQEVDQEEIDRLRSELDTRQEQLNTAKLDRDSHQDDMVALQTALNTTILERDSYKEHSKKLRDELETAKLDLQDKDSVNQAIDKKISAALHQREAHWREKQEAWEKERKVMGKALMRMWGREECGIADETKGEKQMYRYKFGVVKSAKADGVLKDGGDATIDETTQEDELRKAVEAASVTGGTRAGGIVKANGAAKAGARAGGK
ncbi:uncharacterized protein LTR77_008003 [Saxophila tyrrhenica]|uniref:Uncharacterized protein n=1 Tax=Saxophila tyrrhenica TaxID=1690608 RepID=A0AAV9P1H7_9PEZI|nr:hypothetical protein LTR77_008003 [Saxophila tyrrhenica]